LKSPLNIVIIGAGNLSSQLLNVLVTKKELKITQLFNHRSSIKSKALAKKYHCEFIFDYTKINTQADVYLICVKDEAIDNVAKQLQQLHLHGIVAHSSGSITIEALKKTSKTFGVFYPLQTFTTNDSIDWKTTPILIEGNSKTALSVLKELASLLSHSIKVVDSHKRLQFHLAAVFACNFTNALINTSFKIIEKQIGKSDSKLLMPIIKQSIKKLDVMTPTNAQTGPALRGDSLVMKKHLALLKSNTQLTHIYKELSALIISNSKK
jgi:predicted short-subunit dehydrogenase-like oxidoreductase (DUF2520 family)